MYRIHEFARLAGVSVKTLRHYDRLGLLRPQRGRTGHRAYREADLARLEQIVALKFLGMPLRQVGEVLDGCAIDLREALRRQRVALERRRFQIDRAIAVTRAAETSGASNRAQLLRTILEAVHMHHHHEELQRYFPAGARRRARRLDWASSEWKDLYRRAMVAPEAAARDWLLLLDRETASDADLRQGWMQAWRDRNYWPEALKQELATYNLDGGWDLVQRALRPLRRECFSDEAWLTLWSARRHGAKWCELMFDVETAIFADFTALAPLARRWRALDPNGTIGAALAARWREVAADAELPALNRQVALFQMERIWGVIAKAEYFRATA